MDKQYRVLVSPTATAMLLGHVDYMSEVIMAAANRLADEFEEKIQSLSHMPERNPFLYLPNLPEKKYHKLLLYKRYQIIYRISDDRVMIMYVIDCRQDNSWLIF